jgi:hypothetical protein
MGRLKQVGIDVDTNRMIEQHRRSFAENVNDILRRILPLVPLSAAPVPSAARSAPPPPPGTRTRGLWTVEIEGNRIPAANLKSAYRGLLEALSARDTGFMARFSEEKGRSRRFVARTPGQLYAASPHLAEHHAERLADGWYFDTNLSTAQVAKRARIAARICGLRYGSDVRILENLREI